MCGATSAELTTCGKTPKLWGSNPELSVKREAKEQNELSQEGSSPTHLDKQALRRIQRPAHQNRIPAGQKPKRRDSSIWRTLGGPNRCDIHPEAGELRRRSATCRSRALRRKSR